MACTREVLPGLLLRASSLSSTRAPLRIAAAAAWHLLERGGRGGRHASLAAAPAPPLSSWPLARPLVPTRRWSHSQVPAQTKIWDFKGVQKLVQDSKSGLAQNIIIVDTREPGELRSTGRIPTAINIPITTQPDSFHITDDEFADRFDFPRPDHDAELVFYCKAGVRSRAAAQLARDAGWRNVGEYSGSWLDWDSNGGEVQR
ncbi:hypothetical protein RB597_006205 [Gaeumannomyces tritici]